jgi:hypothetical protein
VVEYVKIQRFGYDTVLVILGAGDVYDIITHFPLSTPHD